MTSKNHQSETSNRLLKSKADLDNRRVQNKNFGESAASIESMFRAIADANRDSIILIDEKAKVGYWNPAAEKMFGHTAKEAVGRDIHKLVVPKHVLKKCDERIKTSLDLFRKTGAGYFTVGSVQLMGCRKSGQEFPVELSISPLRRGEKWSAVAVIKDLTERKKSDEKLKEAEQRYHALFDQAPIGVLIIDPETSNFIEFNDTACKQLGYNREEFQKLSLLEIEAKESKNEAKKDLSEIAEKGGGEFETLHLTKDGQTRNVWVLSREVELKGKKCLHCILHDITEIRKVERALLQSEVQYRQLVETAQEGVWVLDKDHITVFVNPRVAEMLGYTESDILGKRFSDFTDVDEASIENGFLPKSQKDSNGNFECEFIKKGGAHIFTNITAAEIKDDAGEILGTLALVTDITVRKEMADKLARYSKALEDTLKQRTQELAEAQAKLIKSERLAAIGELAGMIGHDLRNPLTGIKNAAYFLKRKKTDLPPQVCEMLDIIDSCVAHSNKIINDLLDYSREIRLDRKETTLKPIMANALRMVQIPENVNVVETLAKDTEITVDAEKIVRVFINLIKNALDSMPSGGTIRIDSVTDGDHLEVSISDTGTGIPAEILPNLFLPLLTTKAQGMGFGLAICKRIVEAHGGAIMVKTVVGRGTTFTITIPIETKTNGGEKTWIDHESSLLMTTRQ